MFYLFCICFDMPIQFRFISLFYIKHVRLLDFSFCLSFCFYFQARIQGLYACARLLHAYAYNWAVYTCPMYAYACCTHALCMHTHTHAQKPKFMFVASISFVLFMQYALVLVVVVVVFFFSFLYFSTSLFCFALFVYLFMLIRVLICLITMNMYII